MRDRFRENPGRWAARVTLVVLAAGLMIALSPYVSSRRTVSLAADRAAGDSAAGRGDAQTPPASEPWSAGEVIQPEQLALTLTRPPGLRPLVVCVGFPTLYQSAHVPGSILHGPARDPMALKDLETAAQAWPRDHEIVLYCGCCPFAQCPNVRPAFSALKRMGFRRLRVLYLAQDFAHDWVARGFPVEKGQPAAAK
jgi:thiosulfate/3-mercaptopyruvate sulfurtransferase